LPRRAHHRGRQRRKRGLSKEQICIMSGVNDSGESFLDMAGRGSLSSQRALACLRGRVQDGAVVATDRSGAYPSALRELSAAAHHAYGSRDRSGGTINHVNALHSALDGFMARYRGVSTKHLAEYLAWFRWDCSFNASSQGAGTLVRQVESCFYHTSLGDCWGVEPPYMEYWADRAAGHTM
ncbi:MAG: IS1595 family transposase, partial [Parafannyhessea umbonata]|nr:IS1595 family transposase [Parafannyhessea umbonata]